MTNNPPGPDESIDDDFNRGYKIGALEKENEILKELNAQLRDDLKKAVDTILDNNQRAKKADETFWREVLDQTVKDRGVKKDNG